MASGAPPPLRAVLAGIAHELEAGDEVTQAQTCVDVCMLLSEARGPLGDLSAIAQKLAGLTETAGGMVQKNAIAALTATIESSNEAVGVALKNGVAARAVELLKTSAGDKGLAINTLALLGALAEAGPEAAQAVVEAGGVQALLAQCEAGGGEHVAEGSVDALCKLIASGPGPKDAVATKGAVPVLARALLGGQPEVKVRALLALGMLLGGDGAAARQAELAAQPGALAELLSLMRQTDDAACQQISAGLFAELATNAAVKDRLAEALRASQQQAAEGQKFL